MKKIFLILFLLNGMAWADSIPIPDLEQRIISLESQVKILEGRLNQAIEIKKISVEMPCRVMSCTAVWCTEENPGCNTCTCLDNK